MPESKKLKFGFEYLYSKYYMILTVAMVSSFVIAFVFFFSFAPPNSSSRSGGKTQILPYISAITNPDVYRILTLISFLLGLLCLLLIIIPVMKKIKISKNDAVTSEESKIEDEEIKLDEPQDIKRFTELVFYQLVSQDKKKLALELRRFSDAYYTPSPKCLGKLRRILNKVIIQEDISLSDDTMYKITSVIGKIDNILGNKI